MRETLRKLGLLLWKNFTLKRRQPIVLVIELAWPVVLLLVMLIVRKDYPPRNEGPFYFAPRALPSAGLVPFLQGIVCDPTVRIHSTEPPADDATDFHSFNPKLDSLLANLSHILGDQNATAFDPNKFLSNLGELVLDQQKVNAAVQQYDRTGDASQLEKALGLPQWNSATSVSIQSLLKDPDQFNSFLIQKLGFPKLDADSFVQSKIDLSELQSYTVSQSLSLQKCFTLTDLTQLGQCYYGWKQSPFSGPFLTQGLGSLSKLLTPSSDSSAQDQLTSILTSLLVDTGVLQKLACNQTQEFGKIFVFSDKTNKVDVEGLFCKMTGKQAASLSTELQSQLTFTNMPQIADTARQSTLVQNFYTSYDFVRKELPALADFQKLVSDTLPELEGFDLGSTGDAFSDSNPFDDGNPNATRSARTLGCQFFCGNKSRVCRADSIDDLGSASPPIDYKYSTSKDETSILYRLLNGFKILYAPNTTAVNAVIRKANRTFREVEELRQLANQAINYTISLNETLEKYRPVLLDSLNRSYGYISENCSSPQVGISQLRSLANNASLGNASTGLKLLLDDLPSIQKNMLKNVERIPGFPSDAVSLSNLTSLSPEYCRYIQQAREFLEGPQLREYLIVARRTAEMARDALEAIDLDVWVGFPSENSMIQYAGRVARNKSTVWAGVVFTNLTDNGDLKTQAVYKIRMNTTLIPNQSKLRKLYWTAGPETHTWLHRYELFGFVYIQDMIDRALINLASGKNVTSPGAYLQEIPYPCFIHDNFVRSISGSLPLFMALAWVFSVSMIIRSVVHEKEARLKEIMKIMGMKSSSLWLSWFITSIAVMGTICLLLAMCLKFSQILVYSDFFVIFLFFLNYAFATICLCFLISTFFGRANLAACSGGILYLFTYLPYIIYLQYESSFGFGQKAGLSLLSTTAFGAATTYIGRLEEQGVGIHWNNLRASTIPGDPFSFLAANIFITLDGFIYFFLAWYIEQVFPGSYGIPRRWYFLFTKSYWCSPGSTCCLRQTSGSSGYVRFSVNEDDEERGELPNGHVPYEKEPENVKIGVSVKNLVKRYQQKGKPAVDDLSINFGEGQITSFLGHNGAGKTTTMSVLTGMFPATSGSASVLGMDVQTEIDQIRKVLGLCPQHNVLFEKLTVEEHLGFFARMKGMKVKSEVKREVDQWLDDLGLTAKKKCKVSELSGGMKRKLSVAMAYIGGSKVVILDEPTAGVDPYARRGIWDLVAKHREGRTVILSTHYMDEADILGDRIAIIAHGKLCCAGSPLFLKRHFSDGYSLTLTKQKSGSIASMTQLPESRDGAKSPDIKSLSSADSAENLMNGEANHCHHKRNMSDGGPATVIDDVSFKSVQCLTESVTKVIKSHIPDAELVEDMGTELTYMLPTVSSQGGRLSSLLTELDLCKKDIGIASYGISASPLEEVFLKVTNETEEEMQTDPTTGQSIFNRVRRRQWRRQQSERAEIQGKEEEQTQNVCENDEAFEMDAPLDTESETEDSRKADLHGDAGSCTVTGARLFSQQFKALFIRHFQHTKRYVKGFFAQVILPAIFVTVALTLKKFASVPGDVTLEFTPTLYAETNYFPFKNFEPFSPETNQYTRALAQPCGLASHFLPGNDEFRQCEKYMENSDLLRENLWTEPEGKATNESCYCDGGRFLCPKTAGLPKPPALDTVNSQVLQDLSSKNNVSGYLIETTSQYILERYQGASFGNENPHFPAVRAGAYQEIMDGLVVKKAAKAWYNNKGYHSSPISLNILNNALLRGNLNNSKDILKYGITTSSHSFNETAGQLFQDQLRSGVDLLIAICVIFALAFVPPSFIMILIRERASGAKHLQLVSGVHPVMYWVSNFVWDMLNYMVTVVCLAIIFFAFQEEVYIASGNFAAVLSLLILYGWSMIPLMYPATFIFRDGSTAYVVTMATSLLIGLTTTMATFVLQLITQLDGSGSDTSAGELLRVVFLIFPNFCLGRGLMDIAYGYYIRKANEELQDYGFQIESVGPFSLSMDGIGRNLISMAVCGFVFFSLVLLIEYKFFAPKMCSWRGSLDSVDIEEDESDDDVAAERKRVMQNRTNNSVLTMKNLSKVYGHACSSRPCSAVKGVCLAVPKGECFGLLGVNGAGKTTTFKMLTGDISITDGEARILNYDVATEINNVRQHIGYCPQFDAINDLLTGREHLALYSRLKGVAEADIPKVVDWCLRKLSLNRYGDMPAGQYSGGNKRKLSTAIALIGQPQIIFLDEPTTGMDPKARRFLWSVIHSLVREGKSVILTSHSMEECEALCTRLAVMVNGRFQCLGGIQHLKSKFGDGYTVSLRISGSVPDLESVKAFFVEAFSGAELKDEHHNMLEYQLPTSKISLGSIFNKLEEHRDKLHIEDYSVSQTTMDQVFIRFAKKQGVGEVEEDDDADASPRVKRRCQRVAYSSGGQNVDFVSSDSEDSHDMELMDGPRNDTLPLPV
eukprot:m.11554 g.11554  ORF g.11554 m.11554 type:complete len:2446 (+) comp23502_c1_seq1:90-7427(+)